MGTGLIFFALRGMCNTFWGPTQNRGSIPFRWLHPPLSRIACSAEKNAPSMCGYSVSRPPDQTRGSRARKGSSIGPTHLPRVLVRGCHCLHVLLQLLGELVRVMGQKLWGQDNEGLHHLQRRTRAGLRVSATQLPGLKVSVYAMNGNAS